MADLCQISVLPYRPSFLSSPLTSPRLSFLPSLFPRLIPLSYSFFPSGRHWRQNYYPGSWKQVKCCSMMFKLMTAYPKRRKRERWREVIWKTEEEEEWLRVFKRQRVRVCQWQREFGEGCSHSTVLPNTQQLPCFLSISPTPSLRLQLQHHGTTLDFNSEIIIRVTRGWQLVPK